MKKIIIGMFILLSIALIADENCNDCDNCKADNIDPYNRAYIEALREDTEEYSRKANEYYRDDRFEKAAKYYLLYIMRNAQDANSIYNLACCYGLLGKPELAADYLAVAYDKGFRDIGFADHDGDFDKVRDNKYFIGKLDSLKNEYKKLETKESNYYSAEVFLPGLFYEPESESKDLFVCLHGYGSNYRKFSTLKEHFKNDYVLFLSAPYPALIVGNEMGYSWELDEETGLTDLSASKTAEYIAQAAGGIKERYDIRNVYVMGFSQGGHLAYVTGFKNPGLFDGIIALGTWLDSELIGEETVNNASGLNVFIGHGNTDRSVDPEAGRDAREYLESKEFNVKMKMFEGAHRVDIETLEEAVEWMEEQGGV
ncbi:MAG: dienelactone hydrolase family protein [bacterium]